MIKVEDRRVGSEPVSFTRGRRIDSIATRLDETTMGLVWTSESGRGRAHMASGSVTRTHAPPAGRFSAMTVPLWALTID